MTDAKRYPVPAEKLAADEFENLGDVTALPDPSTVEALVAEKSVAK
ncbi:MAG TPA: hypothetical protein VFL15_05225 [Gammaproteobacteria bacterium]|nr:hypothetical protein [Gammaproteobacteria bacterium]